MNGDGQTQTQSTTMNEATMTQAVADLVTCANLGAKQGMDSTIDHTGAYPEIVADGGIARTTSAQALAALRRYLVNVQAEWAWAAENLVTAGDLTAQSAIHLSNGDLNYAVKRGANPRSVQGLAYGLMKVRGTKKRVARAEARTAAIAILNADGGCFYAEGVTTKDGEQIPYAVVDKEGKPNLNASENKARKAWAREHFGAKTWWTEDKANRLSQAVVQRGPFTTTALSEATQKVRAVQAPTTPATPAPSTTTGATFDGATTPATPTPVEPVVSTDSVAVTLSDDLILGMAKGAGYGSRGGEVTLEGAKLYLRGKGINC